MFKPEMEAIRGGFKLHIGSRDRKLRREKLPHKMLPKANPFIYGS